jgi:hypothetical protein
LKFTDRAEIGTVKTTSEGYVTALARAVRTGIQDYRASELGLMGSHIVKVYRPETEVFHKDSLQSFSHAPVTINHPQELVSSENWKDLAVGEVGEEVLRDGEFLAVSLMLKDQAAIDAVKSGKRELSAGYTADMEEAKPGLGYDFIQRNIRINHLALVDNARAGTKARIGDGADSWGASPVTTNDEVTMTEFTKVVIGDKQFTVAASDADQVAGLVAAKDTAIGELKAKLADAENKILSDEALAAKVKEMSDMKAMRDAVQAKFGDEAVKDASDAEIKGMYRVLDKATDDTARKALADRKAKSMEEDDPWAKVIKKGAK